MVGDEAWPAAGTHRARHGSVALAPHSVASALKLPAGITGKLFAPAAAYDDDGMLYVSFVVLSGPGNSPDSFWMTRSGDGGLSFDEPTRIAGPHTFHTALAVDPKGGRLFAAWPPANRWPSGC